MINEFKDNNIKTYVGKTYSEMTPDERFEALRDAAARNPKMGECNVQRHNPVDLGDVLDKFIEYQKK